MDLVFNKVLASLRYTSEARRRKITNLLELRTKAPEDTISTASALVFWAIDMLTACIPIQAEQHDVFFSSEFMSAVLEYGDKLEKALNEGLTDIPVYHVALVDRKYVLIPSTDLTKNYYNLLTGEMTGIEEVYARPPLEMSYYNLTTIFMRYLERYKKLKEASQVVAE